MELFFFFQLTVKNILLTEKAASGYGIIGKSLYIFSIHMHPESGIPAMTYKNTILIILVLMICLIFFSCTGLTVPAHYQPLSGRGPVVIMISGRTGPTLYGEFAKRLADAGYYVSLYDGNDFPISDPDTCRAKIRDIVKDNTHKRPRKVAVIGYSLGGAAALTCAASLPEIIAGVIVYYPATWLVSDYNAFVDGFLVPITVLQGAEDRYFNCCNVEKITAISLAARGKNKDFNLTVYPQAGHGFNLGPFKNNDLDNDSWRKTSKALNRYLPDMK